MRKERFINCDTTGRNGGVWEVRETGLYVCDCCKKEYVIKGADGGEQLLDYDRLHDRCMPRW